MHCEEWERLMTRSSLRHRLTGLTTVVLLVSAAHADTNTVAYWRFEDNPGYLKDSSGNGRSLITVVSAPTQTAIPGSGNGSKFRDPVPETLESNKKLADNGGAGGYFALTNNIFTVSDFTLEAFVNKEVQTSIPQYFISHWQQTGNQRCYAFGAAGSDSAGTGDVIAPNEVFLLVTEDGQSASTDFVASGFTLELNTDYYVAVSFDESNQATGVTFHLQDLTNGGSLQSRNAGHTVTTLHQSTGLIRLPATDVGEMRLNGLIDEVRVSDTVLSKDDLLVTGRLRGQAIMIR